MQGTDNDVLLVGDLRVDIGQQRVTRAGIEISLPNLSFQLLLALIRAAPNVLSHDLIMARVWPNLIVSPETLTKRVNLLREALGDSAQEPRYIAGLRSRGYRLVAAVSPAPALAPSVESPSPAVVDDVQPAGLPPSEGSSLEPQASQSLAKATRWVLVSLATVACIALAIGWHALFGTHPANTQPTIESRQHDTAAVDASTRTVAVLPFDDISADAADAYLARGIPEMILNRLARLEGVAVISRNSSFTIPTKSLDSKEIGRRLNSGYLISGSVQRDADRLRVAVQLVDASAGTLVWSDHFDRGLHDIFSIEDEVANQLADALSARVGNPAPKRQTEARSANLEAYLAFLRGRTLLGRFTVAESEAAAPYFERAIALDPNFAPAFASLYDAKMQAAEQRRDDLRPVRQRYQHLIDRALALDPRLGSAYFARAMWGDQPYGVGATRDNPLIVARERDFRQGAALDPSNGRGLQAYAEFLRWVEERPEEGRAVLKHVLWVDPMSPSARFTDAMFSLDDNGVRESQRKVLQVLELDPNFVPALLLYAKYRWLIDGKLAESVQVIEHAIALDPSNSHSRHAAMAVYVDLGEMKAARAVVAGMPRRARAAGVLSMRAGDWRRAGLSAYDAEGWTRDDDYCELWQSEALRDYALKTGELRRAIAFIESKYYFADAPAEHLDVCNIGAAVHLSQLLAADQHRDEAATLRRAASSWNDAHEARYLGTARRLRAGILLLEGRQDAALAELAESFRAGFYARWWYTVDLDPLWLPLHDDRRFRAIATEVGRHVEAERTELETLRRQGVVPRRGDRIVAH